MSIEESNDFVGNRTPELPAQPSGQPRPIILFYVIILILKQYNKPPNKQTNKRHLFYNEVKRRKYSLYCLFRVTRSCRASRESVRFVWKPYRCFHPAQTPDWALVTASSLLSCTKCNMENVFVCSEFSEDFYNSHDPLIENHFCWIWGKRERVLGEQGWSDFCVPPRS
jgi:hypothetical protein